jgi:hypothetical protein
MDIEAPKSIDFTVKHDIIDIEKKCCQNKEDKSCQHEFIHDLIEIDPDRSEMIWYCVKCYITQQ